VPLGGSSSFDLAIRIGDSVTFAVSKNIVYIRGDGTEYRLRLLKKEPRHEKQ
jgi:hemin uptake protein HemP